MNIQITLLSSALWLGTLVYAGGDASDGHSHDASPAAVSANSPKRQPDGSVFLPKSSQRQLGIRTVVSEEKSLPKTIELTGRVVADPNAGGRVQPTVAGRIEAGPRGLPVLGQAVRKGEVLAVLRASASPIERANQVAQSAELRASLDQARKRAARLAQLEGTVAQKDQDAARADVASLEQRLAAVQASVSASEALTAPVSGVIASNHVVAGQVVEARELLFEIVDPARLMVEARAFDASLAGNIAGGSASAPSAAGTDAASTNIALQFVGAGRTLVEGAIPLQFRSNGNTPLPWAVQQPVKLTVQTKAQVQGIAMPATAMAKNASNQDVVWVHTAAEQFTPKAVRFTALDGAQVSITDGLKSGDRVVTQGAGLLNQVR